MVKAKRWGGVRHFITDRRQKDIGLTNRPTWLFDRRGLILWLDVWCRRRDLNPHRVTPTGF
jgi:hypothetical protein